MAAGSDYVFPGQSIEKPPSNIALPMQLRRWELEVTAHGFRWSFRGWAAEETSYPRETAEIALAHTISNKVEAAYRRGGLLDKRRLLMEDWTRFVGGLARSS